jgi:hypothetical protein
MNTFKLTVFIMDSVNCYSCVWCHDDPKQSLSLTCFMAGRLVVRRNSCPLIHTPHLALACRVCRCLILVGRKKRRMIAPQTSVPAAAAHRAPSRTASWRPASAADCQSVTVTLLCAPAPHLPARLSAACRCLPHACIHACMTSGGTCCRRLLFTCHEAHMSSPLALGFPFLLCQLAKHPVSVHDRTHHCS